MDEYTVIIKPQKGLPMTKRTLCLILALSCPVLANAADELDLRSIMLTSKLAGGCGIIRQMVNFQEATKMDGGDEFITRFLNTESARLGMTLEEYMQQCVKQTNIYQSWWELAEEMASE